MICHTCKDNTINDMSINDWVELSLRTKPDIEFECEFTKSDIDSARSIYNNASPEVKAQMKKHFGWL